MLLINMLVGGMMGLVCMPIYYAIATAIFGKSLVTHEEYFMCIGLGMMVYLIINLGRD